MFADAETIALIWETLRSTPRKRAYQPWTLIAKVAEEGWASSSDIEDMIIGLDARLGFGSGIDPKWLAAELDLNWRSVYHRPGKQQASVIGFKALAAADVFLLLETIERMGFDIDLGSFHKLMLERVSKVSKLTNSELGIVWYEKVRRKSEPLVISARDAGKPPGKVERYATPAGYKAELTRDVDGSPVTLHIASPKFRRRCPSVETVCAECGLTWYRGDPDSSRIHRAEHKKRMRYMRPVAHSKMAAALATESEPELVTASSPLWKHKEMYDRAAAFRREFGYDFVQWTAPRDDDPHVHGFLFSDEAGVIEGACAFRLRKDEAGEEWWGLQWVWICPPSRRRGILSQRWAALRQRFGDFSIEPPVSPAMQEFVAKVRKRGL